MIRILLLTLVSTTAWAAPITLQHQGRVLDAGGEPLQGEHPFVFELFASSNGGNAVWTGASALNVDDGYYAATLQDGTPTLDSSLFSSGAQWLQVTANTIPLGDRQLLSHVPQAVHAMSVGGGSVVIPDGTPGQCGSNGALARDPSTGALLVCHSGTFAAVDSLPSGCTEGAVIYRTASGWACTPGGTTLQEVSTTRGSIATGAWTTGATGNQSSTGTQILSLTLTPTTTSSTFEVIAVGSVRENGNNSDSTSMAIFRNSESSPLVVTQAQGSNNPYGHGSTGSSGAHHETLVWMGSTGTTAPVTFKVRIGTNISPGIACDQGPCTLTVRERL